MAKAPSSTSQHVGSKVRAADLLLSVATLGCAIALIGGQRRDVGRATPPATLR